MGQADDTARRYVTLQEFAAEHFSVGDIMFRWSTQDNHSVDLLPYVGRISGNSDLFVATGFAGWGMTNGTAAALGIAADLQGEKPSWARVYDPGRGHLVSALKTFIGANAKVARHQFDGSRHGDSVESADDLLPGQGAILSLHGSDCAASRDAEGRLHVLAAQCTHLGCTVAWNEAESSWDCPCHGSRFAADGRVLHGPATHGLEAYASEIASRTG